MVDLDAVDIDAELLKLLPKSAALQLCALPLRADNGAVLVAVSEEYDPSVVNDLAFLIGRKIMVEPVPATMLAGALRKHYGVTDVESRHNAVAGPAEFLPVREEEKSPDSSGDGSVVAFANRMITDAIRMGASDIHVEPYEQTMRVRYRLDGVLHEVLEPSPAQARPIISRLKIMADLDITEKRRPQDGRIRVREGDRTIDIRVSSLPTDFGEKIVLRILDKSQLRLDLTKLGFEERDLRLFQRTIQLPFGMVLVTGPTGSGKTTTLYAALNHINRPDINITTIEDPIEYNLPGINQTHVRPDIGLTFAAALRSILRQDPNVIMVGEIRDSETAEIAIRAALTGHLVFSTLHTNDAPSAIARLIDMGVEPFLVASSVKMILAQRLLRRVCDDCKAEAKPTEEEMESLAIAGGQDTRIRKDNGSGELARLHMRGSGGQARLHRRGSGGQVISSFRGKGCAVCHQSGYKGRTAVYEVLPVQNGLSDLIARSVTASELREKAKANGSLSLREAAMAKALRGETSLGEVIRETGA